MLVRATEACFIGGQRIRRGQELEFEGELPAHLVPVKKGDEVEKPDQTSPVALSQMAMADSKPQSFVDTVTKGKKKTGPDKA